MRNIVIKQCQICLFFYLIKKPQIIEINTIAITGLLVKKEKKDDNIYRRDSEHLTRVNLCRYCFKNHT
jgi:hypothetical protein